MRKQILVPLVAALAVASTAQAAVTRPATLTGPQLQGVAPAAAPKGDTSGTSGANTSPPSGTSGTPAPSAPPPNTNPQSLPIGVVGAPIGVRPMDVGAETAIVAPGTETVIDANGERVAVNTAASVLPAPAEVVPTPALTPAERAAQQRIQAKTARKQQLMHSITPRTKNDRTDQMPDDPIVRP